MPNTAFITGLLLICGSAHAQFNLSAQGQTRENRLTGQRFATGAYFNIEIRYGELWSWGYNLYGELGDSTTTTSWSPKPIHAGNKWTAVSAGYYHAAGLKADGSLWTWGYNTYGQLGEGTVSDRHYPWRVGTERQWTSVACGKYFTLALKSDGSMWAWGMGDYGQLGDSLVKSSSNPVQVGKGRFWKQITCGAHFAMAICSDGTLWTWGYNGYGQLGDGTLAQKNYPVRIGSSSQWVGLGAGNDHSLAIRADGTLWAAGDNTYGQLGDNGTASYRTSFTQIGTDRDWIIARGGLGFSFGIKASGTLWAWGWNAQGQFGNGGNVSVSYPVQIGTGNNYVSAAGGEYHSVAQRSDGTLWTAGRSNHGQIGDGTSNRRYDPYLIDSVLQWVTASVGDNHIAGIKSNGTLWAWGDNSSGQLGDGSTSEKTFPGQIGTSRQWINTSAGQNHTLGLCTDGTLWAWGNNTYGQLGDGSNMTRTAPVQVGSAKNWIGCWAGNGFSLGLQANGTLWAWGLNNQNQLGNGNTTSANTPQQVGNSASWIAGFASAGAFAGGLQSDGSIWVWGANNHGQLSDSGLTKQSIPEQILKKLRARFAIAGYEHALFETENGITRASGANQYGQLGTGTFRDTQLASAVKTGFAPKGVTTGNQHSIALNANGDLFGWGDNQYGQLGDTVSTPRNNPAALSAGGEIVWVSAGGNNTVVLKPARTELCIAGKNDHGQLAAGSTKSIQGFQCADVAIFSLRAGDPGASGFCRGNSLTIPVLCAGNFSKTNTFTAQLSDSSGSFTNTTNLGTVMASTNTNISVTLPYSTLPGKRYRIRIISSSPPLTGKDNGKDLAVFTVQNDISIKGSTPFCEGLSATLHASPIAGYHWIWKKDGSTVPGQTDSLIIVKSSGNYRAVITTPHGCTDSTAEVTITAIPLPVVALKTLGTTTFCEGDSVTLKAVCNPGIKLEWRKNGQKIPDHADTFYRARVQGYYKVFSSESHGCRDSSSGIAIQTNPLPKPEVYATTDTVFCLGGHVILYTGADAGSFFQWFRNGQPLVNETKGFLDATTGGNYNSRVTNGFGCMITTRNMAVTVNPLPVISLQPANVMVFPGQAATFKTGSKDAGVKYQWQKDSGGIFIPLPEKVPYSGTRASVFTIDSVRAEWSSSLYRCYLYFSGTGCGLYTREAILDVNQNGITLSDRLNIDLFPNPVSGSLRIKPVPACLVDYRITDAAGRMISAGILRAGADNIATDGLKPGTYLLRLRSTNRLWEETLRFIKL
ncbi:MAG: T9SS type A sorting domain-containing protein [Bacteroidetes bacterium]|nr:T9SS type A sorting domain-containing protein [Bacteroidota bacterium]